MKKYAIQLYSVRRALDEDFEGTLEAREFDNVLEAGEKFNTSYIIRFGG